MPRSRLAYNELIHRGHRLEFRSVGVRAPGGDVIPRDLVAHPGAVVILPVLDDGSVVLIRNYRHTIDSKLLELPAGTLETGEDPAAAAERELSEETGYAAGRIEPLGSFYASPGITDEKMFIFLAGELRPGEQKLEKYEEISVEVLTEADLRRMILDGTLQDGKTLAALNLYWLTRQASRATG